MLLVLTIYIIAGFIISTIIVKRPNKFWLFVITSIIISSGMMVFGYPIIDEYLLIMLLIGLLLRSALLGKTDFLIKKNDITLTLHSVVFYFFTCYLIFQSFRGLIWLDDIRMLRWIIFFTIVGLSNLIISNFSYRVNKNYAIKACLLSSATFFLLYLLLGVFFEFFLGLNKYDTQGSFWSGTSTALTIPLIVYLIATIAYMNISNFRKSIVIITFFPVIFCCIYYDSRSSTLLIISTLLAWIAINLFKKNKSFLFSFLLFTIFVVSYQTWIATTSTTKGTIMRYLPFDTETSELAVPKVFYIDADKPGTEESSDYDRILIHKAAYNAVKNDLSKFLFGYGWYMARYELIDDSELIRRKFGIDTIPLESGEALQPTGIASLLVDTGLFGVSLFLLNMLLSIISILKSKDSNKYILSLIYCSLIFTFFIGNPTPVLLVWFLIMPQNPLLLMLGKEVS